MRDYVLLVLFFILLFFGTTTYEKYLASEGKVGPITHIKQQLANKSVTKEGVSRLTQAKMSLDTFAMDDPSWLTSKHRIIEEDLKVLSDNYRTYMRQLMKQSENFERIIDKHKNAMLSEPVSSPEHLNSLKLIFDKILALVRLEDYEYLTQGDDLKAFLDLLHASHEKMEGRIQAMVPSLTSPNSKTMVGLIYLHQDFVRENAYLLQKLEEMRLRLQQVNDRIQTQAEEIRQTVDTSIFTNDLGNLVAEFDIFRKKQIEMRAQAQEVFAKLTDVVDKRLQTQHKFMEMWLNPMEIDINLLVADRNYAVQKTRELQQRQQ